MNRLFASVLFTHRTNIGDGDMKQRVDRSRRMDWGWNISDFLQVLSCAHKPCTQSFGMDSNNSDERAHWIADCCKLAEKGR